MFPALHCTESQRQAVIAELPGHSETMFPYLCPPHHPATALPQGHAPDTAVNPFQRLAFIADIGVGGIAERQQESPAGELFRSSVSAGCYLDEHGDARTGELYRRLQVPLGPAIRIHFATEFPNELESRPLFLAELRAVFHEEFLDIFRAGIHVESIPLDMPVFGLIHDPHCGVGRTLGLVPDLHRYLGVGGLRHVTLLSLAAALCGCLDPAPHLASQTKSIRIVRNDERGFGRDMTVE